MVTIQKSLYPEFEDDENLSHYDMSLISQYNNDMKVWTAEMKKIKEDQMIVFSIVWGQMSESSRCELDHHEDWNEKKRERDVIYLISRIRATHIARQSGNELQDQERVRAKWYTMRMAS